MRLFVVAEVRAKDIDNEFDAERRNIWIIWISLSFRQRISIATGKHTLKLMMASMSTILSSLMWMIFFCTLKKILMRKDSVFNGRSIWLPSWRALINGMI